MENLFALLAFCLLAAALLLTLLFGASVYRSVASQSEAAAEQRLCLSYLAAKVRHSDAAGAVFCADFHDPTLPAAEAALPALYLTQQFNGVAYATRVYVYDGYLRELFADASLAFAPGDGQAVLKADALRFAETDGMLEIVCRVGAQEQSLRLALRSETGWPDE